MIIKHIKLTNFRQFYLDHKIDFSQDEDQNITLVLGDNTSGKTTLLQSFLWGFYGEANFKRKESLLNAKVSQEMLQSKEEQDVKVEIELEHQGIDYYICRSLTHYVKGNTIKANKISTLIMSYKGKNGELENIQSNKIQSKINEILPANLAAYFLYDTERFDSIATKSDVTNSVKSILGLTVLENIQNHLGTQNRSKTVLHQFNSSLNLEGNKIAQEAFNKLKKYTEEKENVEKRLKQQHKELETYKKLIVEKQDILRSLESSALLQQEKDQKVKNLTFEINALENAQRNFYKSFQQNSHMYLGRLLFEKVKTELKDAQLDKKAIRDMNANAIKDIIARGKCVCGSEICEGNDAHQNLLEEIRYLPPESIGTLVKYFKDKADTFFTSGSNYFLSLESCYKNVLSHQTKIGELEDDIRYLNEKLSRTDSVGKHQSQLVEFENKAKSIETLIAQLNQRIGELNRMIRDNQDMYDKNITVSDKNNEILHYLKYAEEILEWVKNRYYTREKEIKIQLENKVNEYFSKMYHGKRKVVINDRFEVDLMTTDLTEEIQTDESQGLGTVKNFAFIAGLVDLAKQKLKDSYEKDAEAYPLILDAPFSNADEIHVKTISEVLPSVANQLILIVMAKDWNYAKSSLSKKVGKEYYLDKQSEIYTILTEVK